MLARIVIPLHTPVAVCVAAFGLLTLVPVGAQAPRPPAQSAQFDPSDVYFQGYLAARAAEQLEAAEDYIGAIEKLTKANQLFEAVRKFYPDWKPEMVQTRKSKTMETISRVRPKADELLRENRKAVAELEGGVRAPGTLVNPAKNVTPLPPGILEVDPLQTRRLKDAEAEVQRLRKLNADATKARNLSRKDLQTRLLAAENTVKTLRSQLAAAPMEREMKSLGNRINTLEQEKQAMSMALEQSRGAHTEALAKIDTLEADLKVMRQKRSDLDRDLKTERKISNSVITGMRKQLDALEKQLKHKNTELTEANQRIRGLIEQLQESRDAFAEIRTERDSLLQERDQMRALLKLNEAGRIQELIEQNMALVKNLREANKKVERLNRESNADKDAITDALRDLAIAKSQINRLHQDKQRQQERLKELENRLTREELALSRGQASADPMEVKVLRDIIKRQLRIQERRRQARDLLVEAAKDLGARDERLAKAIELFDNQEIILTPEEQKLIANKRVDGEFVSPYARDRATVGQATAELNRDIAVFERTAEKSFVAGRMLPTRELYEMILDQHPGHTPSLCRLGVVHLRLQEPAAAADTFRRAVELDPNNPYAYQMLGATLTEMGELPTAERALRRAVELAPNETMSHRLLGIVCYRLGEAEEAKSHFKAAISADPLPSESYYNLALICSRSGHTEDAKRYYHQALQRGAIPDPALEKTLAKQ